ncbi:hypothetical protein [Achromobacter xylosoxidans]|uniref:hypothetical protein n=1 Tax=Alcaligenes xylosoxydans xylosoxydans TaxID=85698 RepID=UPI0018FE1978|nr:hypothetical protein [Achromobacter xylosoxidans]
MEKIFIIPFHVGRGADSIMPVDFLGAYVSCFTSGESYVAATEKALAQLQQDGMVPEEILQPIFELASGGWSEYIKEKWPSYVRSLPNQIDFYKAMRDGLVVYGPFGSYS